MVKTSRLVFLRKFDHGEGGKEVSVFSIYAPNEALAVFRSCGDNDSLEQIAEKACEAAEAYVLDYDPDQDWLSGEIEIEIGDIIDRDLEGFLDFISEELTGTDLLMEVDYSIVKGEGTVLTLKVEGRAEGILDVYDFEDEKEQLQEWLQRGEQA